MAVDRLLFPRSTSDRVYVERVPVQGVTCPSCRGSNVARYPVASYLGPRIVTKCQDCFAHVSRERSEPADRWPPWRSATRDWPASRLG